MHCCTASSPLSRAALLSPCDAIFVFFDVCVVPVVPLRPVCQLAEFDVHHLWPKPDFSFAPSRGNGCGYWMCKASTRAHAECP